MRIRNKRESIARLIADSRFIHLIERAARRGRILVATHHRIGVSENQPFYDLVFSATPESFAGQIRLIRDRYRIITLTELIDMIDRAAPLGEAAVLIAFDDGYRDHYDIAFPILRDLGVPATFFLPTRFIGGSEIPWWDRIAYIVKAMIKHTITLDHPREMKLDRSQLGRDGLIRKLVEIVFAHRDLDISSWLIHLSDRAGVDYDLGDLGEGLFMNWDQAREMAAAGMSFGSHSHTHRELSRLTEAEVRDEFHRSKGTIERALGTKIEAIAYPFGRPETLHPATTRLAIESGYRVGFTATTGPIDCRRSDPAALSRIAIGAADSPRLVRARLALHASIGRSPL